MPELLGLLPLAVIVFVAFGIEAALGFGCTVLAVTMGVHFYTLEHLLPVLVCLNLLLSAYIVVRHRQGIVWRVLLLRILPLMGLGMPLGMVLFGFAGGAYLKLGFGLFVTLVAGFELYLLLARPTRQVLPLGTARAAAALVAGGVMHGLYASGGPMAVYFASRQLADKRQFRSTLSLLWLVLNAVLLGGYVWRGVVDERTGVTSVLLLLPLVAGIFAGEWLHRRVNERSFRLLVFALLLLGGLVLVAQFRG